MKKHLLWVLLWLPVALVAEELPASYYAPAEGLQDSVLKTQLSQIIAQGERYKYGAQDDNSVNLYTWNGFITTDRRADGTIWDMYSTLRHYFTYNNRGAAGMAIEHSFPKSWWGGEDNDAYKDLFHLTPSEHRANTAKSDRAPGIVDSTVTFSNDIFKVGYMQGHPTFRVFEPCDEYKGDFARAYFYVATCYENFHWIDTVKLTSTGKQSLASTSGAYFAMDNSSYLEFQPWLQAVLLAWHRADPVSLKEIQRQNAVSSIQHNRNPYIDYPELVEYIWGNKAGQAVHFDQLTLTCSEDYVPPFDTNNIMAYPATEVSETGFTANWQSTGSADYILEVYHKEVTGHNDTLFYMPAVTAKLVAATDNISWDGTTGTSDGSCAMLLGTNAAEFHLTISGLTIPQNSRLIVRASVSKYDSDAGLHLNIDGAEQDEELTLDETYYSFPLPEGAQSIVLSNSRTKHRVSVQSLCILSGDEAIIEHSLPDFPQTVTGDAYAVSTTLHETEPVYYRITPASCAVSNEIKVQYFAPSAVPNTEIVNWTSTINNGVLALQELPLGATVRVYEVSGQLLFEVQKAPSTASFRLPKRGVYVVTVNQQSQKVSW